MKMVTQEFVIESLKKDGPQTAVELARKWAVKLGSDESRQTQCNGSVYRCLKTLERFGYVKEKGTTAEQVHENNVIVVKKLKVWQFDNDGQVKHTPIITHSTKRLAHKPFNPDSGCPLESVKGQDPTDYCPVCGKYLADRMDRAGIAKHILRCRTLMSHMAGDEQPVVVAAGVLDCLKQNGPCTAHTIQAKTGYRIPRIMAALGLLATREQVKKERESGHREYTYYI